MEWRRIQWIGLMLIVLAISLVAGCGVNQPPTAEILSPSDGNICCAGKEITFQGKGEDPERKEVTYRWNFDDGTVLSGPDKASIPHVYKKPGTYTVTLTVSDGQHTVSDRIQIRVLGPPKVKARAWLVVNGEKYPASKLTVLLLPRLPPSMPVTVAFDGSASLSPNGRITHWKWDFGGRASSSEPTLIRLYRKPGTYAVTLTVTDEQGAQGQATLTVSLPSPKEACLLRHVAQMFLHEDGELPSEVKQPLEGLTPKEQERAKLIIGAFAIKGLGEATEGQLTAFIEHIGAKPKEVEAAQGAFMALKQIWEQTLTQFKGTAVAQLPAELAEAVQQAQSALDFVHRLVKAKRLCEAEGPSPPNSAAVYGCLALWHAAGKALPKDRASWREFQGCVGQTEALIGGAIQAALGIIKLASTTDRKVLRQQVINSLAGAVLSDPRTIGQVRQILTDLGIDVSELSDEEVADKFALALADSADNPLYEELLTAADLLQIDEAELKEINEEFRRIKVESTP